MMGYEHSNDCDCEVCESYREYDLQQKPEVQACAVLIRKVYEFAGGGGDLHSIIDDDNVDWIPEPDDPWIGEYRKRKGPLNKKRQTYSGLEKAERACVVALAELSIDERYAAINLAHEQMNGATP
jgi:hypothetical protein